MRRRYIARRVRRGTRFKKEKSKEWEVVPVRTESGLERSLKKKGKGEGGDPCVLGVRPQEELQ
jgi:hypothetical protein